MATTKVAHVVVTKVKLRPKCTPRRACSMLERALEETTRFAKVTRGSAMEVWLQTSGASGVAYRTGNRVNSSLLALNYCPWCALKHQVNKPAPKGRARAKAAPRKPGSA